MIKNKQTRRTIAMFFLLNFLSTIFPYNVLYANNNGPNAPEAAAFEPVDATDMVNLVTGNLSYVLPLLNVPSPEGGYPLALNYHAGIAMDQEASWVGLGWNLNPGAINRGVNGNPDDWGKTSVNEFFYDKGWSEDYYSFSVGTSLSNGFSVGLGLSWGSNQSLSGSVSFGVGGSFVNIDHSGVSAGIGLRAKGANISFATNGINAGYGYRNSNSVLGLNLNYNYSNGLSGSFSSSTVVGYSGKGAAQVLGTGISFNSQGVSMNGSLNGAGIGVFNSSEVISSQDYSVRSRVSGFSLPVFMFYVGYQHKEVKYSLFKNNTLNTSGILYPYVSNSNRKYNDGTLLPYSKRDHFMDVSDIYYKSEIENRFHSASHGLTQYNYASISLPSYDNYSVNSQGISGSISPYNDKMILSPRSIKAPKPFWWKPNDVHSSWDNDFGTFYLNRDITEITNEELNKKSFFTFQDAYNSFLRIETSDIEYSDNIDLGVLKTNIFQKVKTNQLNNYSNDYANGRKREGNTITTFTNKEIRSGVNKFFLEAKDKDNFLNRSNKKIFLNEGIGAFQITAMDGKTYHYSLPVYQFESYYKTFQDKSNENKNFFEKEKNAPYATHWLLTAITGPDYVDTNNNGELDNTDYGYWIDFDYGKWSEGFGWRIPIEGYEETENEKGKKSYSYSKGRKEIYYLDAIKTRTHTALFVKEIREDNKSHNIKDYIYKAPFDINSNTFNIDIEKNGLSITTDDYGRYLNTEIYEMYTAKGDRHNLKLNIPYGYFYKKTRRLYRDVPENYSLKLNKIILLKNDHYSYRPIEKQNDHILGRWKELGFGAISKPLYGIEDIKWGFNGVPYEKNTLYWDRIDSKIFRYNIGKNILDIYDLDINSIERKALQVINFDYDYKLARNSPNSSYGKLSLRKILFKGKKGIGLIPPYEFNYEKENTMFNLEDKDNWGYNSKSPDAWSLNNIKTPLGGNIKIEYESDSYFAEASSLDIFKLKVNVDRTNKLITTNNEFVDFTKYYQSNDYFSYSHYPRHASVQVEEVSEKSIKYKGDIKNKHEVELLLPKDYIVKDETLNGFKGGGLRVKKISVSNNVGNEEVSSNYLYLNEETGRVSGITSYAPTKKNKLIPFQPYLPSPLVMYSNVQVENKDKNGKVLGKENYEFETIKVASSSGRNEFNFGRVFSIRRVQDRAVKNGTYTFDYINTGEIYSGHSGVVIKPDIETTKYMIESRLGAIGRLKKMTKYNHRDHVLQRVKNNYKEDLNKDKEIGVFQESHINYKRLYGFSFGLYVTSTSKINYPSVLESVEETSGGLTVTKHFDKHDFLTGQVLETRTYASDGKAFKTKHVPAYTIPEYAQMGSKIDNVDNKNMLTQGAVNYTYLYKDNTWRPINVGVTTWKNEWTYKARQIYLPEENDYTPTESRKKVWRKHKEFVWNGEIDEQGLYTGFDENSHDDFQWGIGASQTNSDWREVSEITAYNRISQPLEVKDINGNYASTRMTGDNSKVLATSNAAYKEMYYSGADNLSMTSAVLPGQGGVALVGIEDGAEAAKSKTSIEKSHTGKTSILVDSNVNCFTFLMKKGEHRTGEYKISLWVDKGNESKARVMVNGNAKAFNGEKVYAGSWVLLNHYEDILSTEDYNIGIRSTTGTLYADDFRLHPATSSMTSYVYNQWDEVTFITGANGLSTCYVYDDAGRLKETWVEVVDNPAAGITGGFKKVSTNSYNYKKNQ
ncbi:conserved protein of unknown function [Tenacibaculum sp. 190524A02b]|uniref:hypothetical protein n=1 Tax=Tenacibaculum vairaonense TaxID=3137860 RepID=UPI0032B27486